MPFVPLYVFIDEGGDFNFTPTGSKFYIVTAVFTHCPWELLDEAAQIKHNVLSGEYYSHLGQEYLEKHLCHGFHASEDIQAIRDEFYKVILKMTYIGSNSVVVRKNKTNPTLRDPLKFYPKVVSSLLGYVFKKYQYSKLCVFVDSTPVNKNKSAFLKAMKEEIKNKQPDKEFSIYFPPSASNLFLQVSDYINWAIVRKWEKEDLRSYDLIKKFLTSPELDMFKNGDMEYYHFKK